MNGIRRQRGITLLIALVMLVIITLFAVSTINSSSIELQIVGNMQAQKSMEQSVESALEQTLSGMSAFSGAIANPDAAATVVTVNNVAVSVSTPRCLGASPAAGYSAASTMVPEDTDWEVSASVTDSTTGAAAVIHQGVKILMTAGNCT